MHAHSPRGFFVLLALSVTLVASAETQGPARPTAPPTAKASSPARKPATAALPVTSLEVAVTDPAGKPVEGALVRALPVQGAYRRFGALASEKVRSTLTGREGKAKLESLPRGPWNLSVHARGFVTYRAQRVASGPLAVRLEKGGAVTGVVAEADGKRPVAGARVSVDEWLAPPRDWEEDATRNEAVTDAGGRFRLEGIGRASLTVAARAPGFARAERRGVRAGDRVELVLFPGATLSGTVRDDAGRPVTGAVVRAEGGGLWSAAPPAERTDARGAFVMPGVDAGDYVVVAREGGRAPAVATAVVEAGSDASVPLTLSDGGFATGRIVDDGGRPLAGRVRVEVFEDRGLPAFASELLTSETKADGQFALGPLPLGRLGLVASAAGHASRPLEAEVPARGRTADLGDVTLETGLSMRGRVADRDGEGIAGATVVASGLAGDRSRFEATSEADGAFVVGGLKPGLYEVRARAAGYAAALAKAEAGGDPVELVMEAGGQIAGSVVDAQGQPVEEARIEARATDTQPFDPGRSFFFANADEGGGRFVLRDVASGTYDLEAQATGYGAASVTNVRVSAGRTTSAGTLTLGRGGVARGTVVDPEGQGIPGASVYADRDTNTRTTDYSSQTDSAGVFEIRGLPTGRFEVRAHHPSYAPGKPASVEVDPDKEPVPARLVLARGGRLEGHVRHRDGRPFAEGRVMVSGSGGAAWPEPAVVGDDGSFVADHLAPGTATVTVMTCTGGPYGNPGPGVTSLTGIAMQEVELREDETTTAEIALRDVLVAGRVTRGSQPAPGVRVSIRVGPQRYISFAGRARPLPLAVGPPHLAATTREDGSYELVVFTPGPVRVDLQSTTSPQAYPGREVAIPDAERYELDLEIADTTASGAVVDRETGDPVGDVRLSLQSVEPETRRRGWGSTGADGRFAIAVEPGGYQLEADAAGRPRATLPVTVGPAGVQDLRVEMERGLAIVGRLVDTAGRPAGGYPVTVTAADDGYVPGAEARADGSFRLDGLSAQPYVLAAGSPLAGYAVRGGVVPSEEPVVLTLRPGGRVAVRVLGPDGRAVREAYPLVETVDGLPVDLPGLVSGPTDAGTWELPAPAGSIGVVARHDSRTGKGKVEVRPGETAPLTVVLEEEPANQP